VTAAFEASFAGALLDAAAAVPAAIDAPGAQTAARRFAVHRNNVVAGLVNALRSRFPATEKIVGDEFFAVMARAFVVQEPPNMPVLARYGDEFPSFVAAFTPARELPYLADVAELEAARTRAYHAADAVPVDARTFAALDANTLGGVRIALHPSAEIVRSPYPIVTIWAMNSGERKLAAVEDWRGEDALVIRPHLDVEVRLLPPGGAAFLLALAAGETFAKAAEAALVENSEFDLADNLAGLITWGVAGKVIQGSAPQQTD
jgi:putative DNA-binding protein